MNGLSHRSRISEGASSLAANMVERCRIPTSPTQMATRSRFTTATKAGFAQLSRDPSEIRGGQPPHCDLVLKVNAHCYSIEASNPRHEHEWRVWEKLKLPDGKILMPGVVAHAS